MNPPWNSVAIVGVGLIGGSVGQALLQRKLARRVIGIGRSRQSLEQAHQTGAVSEISLDLAATAEADLVLVAATVAAIPQLLEAVDVEVRPGTLLTDAGSTKDSIVSAWERNRRRRRGRFVGSHPLAGSHRRGPQAADGRLFEGRVVVVTPATPTPPEDAAAIGGFWAAVGSTVVLMPPREHDELVAATSHAPHVLAAAIAAATPPAALPFTAGGWRDTTRIAAGDAELWAEILLDNALAVASAIRRIDTTTRQLLAAIEAGDRPLLVTLLSRAKDARDALGS